MDDTRKTLDGETLEMKSSQERIKPGSVKRAKRLTEFKTRIEDITKPEYDDEFFTKWLKARQYDVNKAEQMLRQSLVYRERMNVDTLLNTYTPPEVLQKYLPGGFSGYDHDGTPIRVELFGRLDIKGLMYSTRRSDLEKTKLLQCERTVQDWKVQSERSGKRVSGLTVLFDMEGVGTEMLWRPGLAMYLHLVKVMEDNYPEMMKRMFVINAPRIFPLLYKICRPLVSEDMKNKIHVLAGNYMTTLLKFMDEDQIPKFLGGTKTGPDGDARCTTMIGHGGKVPDTYHLTDVDMTLNMETGIVPRADKLQLPYTVWTVGSIIRWEFKTEDYDIGFGIWRQEGNGHRVKVVETVRYNSHIMTEDGSYIVDQPGTYIICFDNSFSWTHSKKIRYCIEILTNEVDEDTKPDLEKLIQAEDWSTLMDRFETTHL